MTFKDIAMLVIFVVLPVLIIGSIAHLIYLEREYQQWLKDEEAEDEARKL